MHVPLHRNMGSLRFALPSSASPSGHYRPERVSHAPASRSYSWVRVPHVSTRGKPCATLDGFHHLPQLPPVTRGSVLPPSNHRRCVVCRRWRVASTTPQPMFCSLIFYAFPSFLRVVKVIFTIGFVLTPISVFFAVMAVFLLFLCCSSIFYDVFNLPFFLFFYGFLSPCSTVV